MVRFKCFLLKLGTAFEHSIASLVNVAYKIVKLVSFSHFWIHKIGEESYSFKGRLKDAGQDLLRVVTAPIALVGLELAGCLLLIMVESYMLVLSGRMERTS